MSKLLDRLAEIFPVNPLEALDELRVRSSELKQEIGEEGNEDGPSSTTG